MKSCVAEIIEQMIQNYDICFKNSMNITQYKINIINSIDRDFEKMYNKYKKEKGEKK